MLNNLEKLRDIKEPYKNLRDIILDISKPKEISLLSSISIPSLNPSQLKALNIAISSKDISLIHGPPGTGKTTTAIEIIKSLLKDKKKILACADSNIAVDNILSRLSKEEISLTRVGHIARVEKDLEQFNLRYKAKESLRQKEIKELKKSIEKLTQQRDQFIKPTPSKMRGLSYEEILNLAKTKKAKRGLTVYLLEKMAKWIEYNKEIDLLYSKLKKIEEEILKEILENSDVVCATNSTAASEVMEELNFDVAIIDEGSQQIEPSTLIPLLKAKKVVILGDHKQLPPTLISNNEILKKSLFERLIGKVPSNMLQIQYRMNKEIMEFPNKEFYNNKLIAHQSVANRYLEKIESNNQFVNNNLPVEFIDTSKCKYFENLKKGSNSYENHLEAKIVIDIVKEYLNANIHPNSIGVITPYLAQVKLIKKLLNQKYQVEVKSVDGFQGREKDIIIISFVRSNLAKNIGFLNDERRLNVAITRAKKKLIMIGDLETLKPTYPFSALFDYLQKKNFILEYKD